MHNKAKKFQKSSYNKISKNRNNIDNSRKYFIYTLESLRQITLVRSLMLNS
jgi:hypothetical protein